MVAGRYLSILAAFLGVVFLLSLTLFTTHPELDIQDRYFLWVTVGLSAVALLKAIFIKPSLLKNRFGITDGFVALFFLWLFVNYHFVSTVDASSRWLQTVYMVILYGSLRIILPAHRGMDRFLVAGLMICGLWEATVGYMQLFGFVPSLSRYNAFTGTFFNDGPYGGFLAVTLSVAFGFMVVRYQKFNRLYRVIRRFPKMIFKNPDFALYLLCVLSFFASFSIFFSAMSRAAILGLLVSVLVILFSQRGIRRRLSGFFAVNCRKKLIVAGMVIALFLSGLGSLYYLKKESAQGRLVIWSISCNMIAKAPLFGTGFGSFFGEYGAESAEYFRARPQSSAIAIADVPEYGFNEYLQTGAESGLIGLALLAAILFGALYRLLRVKSLFAGGLVVIMIFAFFSFPFSQLPFQILLVVFVAASSGWSEESRREERRMGLSDSPSQEGKSGLGIFRILLCVVLLVLGLGFSGLYGEKIGAAELWKKARIFYRMQHYTEAAKECAVLYPLLKDNPRFLFEYGHALNKTDRFAQSNAILKEGAPLSADPMFYNVMGNNYKGLGEVERAEAAYLYAFDILPNRLYPLYLLMKLYEETEQYDKSMEMAQRVIEFVPKIDSPAIRDMKREAEPIRRRAHEPTTVINHMSL